MLRFKFHLMEIKEKHDLHRKTQYGEPTYQIVMNNIKKTF